MRRSPQALRANAAHEGVNGPAKLLYEVTGKFRASSWSFGGRRRQISFTGSKALTARSGLQPIRLSQCLSIGRQGRSPLIHAISFTVEEVDDPPKDRSAEWLSSTARSSVRAAIAILALPTEIAAHTAASHIHAGISRDRPGRTSM